MSGVAVRAWAPAAVLSAGLVLTLGGGTEQRNMPLEQPLSATVLREIDGYVVEDLVVSDAEQSVAGMDDYVLRLYTPAGIEDEEAAALATSSVYVGYYERQRQGHTIHSPKNCLPGGGWEPLVSSRERIAVGDRTVPVNRYLIGNGPAQAVVLYWYQGRGRVEANEYTVKWELLRDQALHGRSDEALVRVIVPVTEDGEQAAYDEAVRLARLLVPSVDAALPS